MIRRAHFTLYLTGREALVLLLENEQAHVVRRFEPHDIGLQDDDQYLPAAFDHWLAQIDAARHARFDVLLDSVDEVQHLEELPRARPRDRKLLLARRLKQRFPDTEFATWTRIKRRPGTPRQATVQVLLSGLRADEHLTPWINALLRAQAPIGRIVSPALLAPLLLDKLLDKSLNQIAPAKAGAVRTGLLVSVHPAGLRQTLLVDGHLKFSRIAPIAGEASGALIAAEVKRTLQYLLTSQQLSRDAVRDAAARVWVLDAGVTRSEELPAAIDLDNAGPVDIMRASAAGPFTPEAPGLSAWLAPALNKAASYGLSNIRVRRFTQLAAWRRGLWLGGGTAACAAVLAALAVEWHVHTQRVPLQLQAATSAQGADVSAAERLAVVQAAAEFSKRHVDAPQLLARIASALNSDDALTLTDVAWNISHSNIENAGAAQDNAAHLLPPLRIELRGVIDARIGKTDANERVQQLAQRLNRGCACNTVQLALPYDPAPHSVINTALKRDEAAAAVPFSVTVEQQLPDQQPQQPQQQAHADVSRS